jgi:predicted small lipoprotein YifL
MHRRLLLAMVLVAAATLAGCGKSPPREYTKAEFEAYVAQKCKLKEVTLEPKGDGKFVGTGVDGDGRTYQVEATQEANRISWMAKHGEMKPGGVIISTSGSEGR